MKIEKKVPVFEDERGKIIDILESEFVEHATLITFKKGAIRANHYHKESAHYTFVLSGRLKLLTQKLGEPIETTVMSHCDLIYTPPMERHAMIALENSEILVLARGLRGGKNYEKDTYRLTGDESLLKEKNL